MGLKKLLRKIGGVASTAGPIIATVGAGPVSTSVLIRQLLLIGGSSLAAKGYVSGSDVEPIVGAVIAIGTIVAGQLDKKREKDEKATLALIAKSTVPATSAEVVIVDKTKGTV